MSQLLEDRRWTWCVRSCRCVWLRRGSPSMSVDVVDGDKHGALSGLCRQTQCSSGHTMSRERWSCLLALGTTDQQPSARKGLRRCASAPLRTRVRTHSRGLRAPLRVVRVRGGVCREGHEERARNGAAAGVRVPEGGVGVWQRAQAPAKRRARGRRDRRPPAQGKGLGAKLCAQTPALGSWAGALPSTSQPGGLPAHCNVRHACWPHRSQVHAHGSQDFRAR